MSPASRLHVESLFDEGTSTFSHIVVDRATGQCALVGSVLDHEPASGRTTSIGADRLIARVRALGARVQWLLETHLHADHLSAAPHLQQALGGQLGIDRHISTVQQTFGRLFNAGSEFARDGRQFDRLLNDGERFAISGLEVTALHTPGHTPACMTYLVRDPAEPGQGAAFVGVMFHDYPPGGRPVQPVCTVADQRARNVHVNDGVSEDEFVGLRTARDGTLKMPTLLLPSVQVNMRAGHFPPPEDNGVLYLKIPLNAV